MKCHTYHGNVYCDGNPMWYTLRIVDWCTVINVVCGMCYVSLNGEIVGCGMCYVSINGVL